MDDSFDPRKQEAFQKRYQDFIGQSIIDGLLRPEILPGIGDLLQNHGQGGNYRQSGGGSYSQSGGGDYSQSGGGDYTQSSELPR
ncbi:hypothetical protein [Thioalkalivibrio sp. ALJ3]|uniref:hypothetical protein n=1 Tax=Thioalkalivibrio sp. ALJ3 TaxID=1240557 RepID=UPI00035DD978|nr:hypothetical protein [Thioalkalivibrio sp. ALJ3]